MKNNYPGVRFIIFLAIFLWQGSALQLSAQTHNVDIIIHLRGVYESKISLLSLAGSRIFKPINEVQGVKNGNTIKISVSKEYLPGEFVLRFDYKEKESSTPYPSEKNVFLYDQDIELWVSPIYCNNSDSSYFQGDERENSAFARFSVENGKQKEKLGLLQNFLMSYDDTESAFYRQGIVEYEQRRNSYNNWLTSRTKKDKALFVSNLYGFQYLPDISWKGSETDRINNMINHYFDGLNFQDPFLIKTSVLNKYMDNYVNLYGQLSTTTALRDSLFPLAGRTAIEKARAGHPLVYGWMVDYFYRGYESNGITAGMKILEPYINDSNCLTSKRQEISRRLKGMQTLVPGTKAPDFSLKDLEGNLLTLGSYGTQSKYILVIFWSADCSHCVETINKIHPWQQQPEEMLKMTVIAISLDETETEIKAWDKKGKELTGWRHIRAPEGIRSKVAADYYILATPVMVLLDAKTKEIVALPNTISELMAAAK